jgi:hypothetical protein
MIPPRSNGDGARGGEGWVWDPSLSARPTIHSRKYAPHAWMPYMHIRRGAEDGSAQPTGWPYPVLSAQPTSSLTHLHRQVSSKVLQRSLELTAILGGCLDGWLGAPCARLTETAQPTAQNPSCKPWAVVRYWGDSFHLLQLSKRVSLKTAHWRSMAPQACRYWIGGAVCDR